MLNPINSWLTKNVDRIKKLQDAGKEIATSLSKFLHAELERSVTRDEEIYSKALNARSYEEKHESMLTIAAVRKAAVEAGSDEVVNRDGVKEPRKKGYLEKTFDYRLESYLEDPSEEKMNTLMGLVCQLEVNRRVHSFYDIQKLRIGSENRARSNNQNFGVSDFFIDYSAESLARLERQNEKMVDKILRRSPDAEFYAWLVDNHLGVGVMMAGCIISELSAPERFRTIGSCWAYCGLHVVNNDPDTKMGGKAPTREKGQAANWNSFLRSKMLGVLPGTMLKSQTRYIGTPDEKTKAANVKCLNDYKHRITQRNDMIPECDRIYNSKGKEQFRTRSVKEFRAYRKDKILIGEMKPCDIPRRSLGHINNMSKRYMVKIFLQEALIEWFEIKGLEAPVSYDEAILRNGVPHLGNKYQSI